MGQVNQPSNLLDRIKNLERRVVDLAKRVGLSSATIARGGLSLVEGAFLRLLDTQDREIVYIGGAGGTWALPDGSPQPVVMIQDSTGRVRFGVFDPDPADGYQPVVWIFDHDDHVAFTTDKNGGVAEPWIPIPMYAFAHDTQSGDATDSYLTLPVSACDGGVVWEGRIGKVSHPRIQVDMICGRATGTSGVPTYRLIVDGTVLDEWTDATLTASVHGPYDIAHLLGRMNVAVQVTVSATGTATDRVAAQMLGTWLRQT